MSSFLDSVGPWAPLVVFALAAAEASLFLGVFVPGELAVILGGVIAGTGRVSLALMVVAAVLGAIIGDSIGYGLGRRLGPGVSAGKRFRTATRRLESAASLLAERGWWALVVARFTALLRAVVPFAAGMGRMPYRRFIIGNVIGGVLWGTAFTLVGYFAGASYPTVEHWIRTGGLAVVTILVLLGGIVWLTRWAERNRESVMRLQARFASWRPIRYIATSARRARRSSLVLVLAGMAIVAGLWLFGGLLQDVLSQEEFFFFDLSAIRYLAAHQAPLLVRIATTVNDIMSWPWIVAVTAGAAVVFVIRRRPRVAAALAVSAAGQWLMVAMITNLVGRMPPPVTPLAPRMGYGFPSETVALVTAAALTLAWPWGRSGWRMAVIRFGAAAFLVALTAASRVVLLLEYPSDGMAAIAVSTVWAVMTCLVFHPPTTPEASTA